jgi:hypothetical protein
VNADLIQRALISRIEALELELNHATAIYGELWRELFPGTPHPADDKSREVILKELKRRGLGNGKAGE